MPPFVPLRYSLPLPREVQSNIEMHFYQSGHMLYIDSDSHTKLKHDVGEFVHGAVPQ